MRWAAGAEAAAVLMVSTAPVHANPVDSQPVLAVFTGTIWPAVVGYHGAQSQTSAGSIALNQVTDTGGDADARTELRTAVGDLGGAGYDQATQTTSYSDGLQLGGVQVVAADSASATLDVCFTYTHHWYQQVANTRQAPAASRATFGLVNSGGGWMLRSLTGDHPVEGCSG